MFAQEADECKGSVEGPHEIDAAHWEQVDHALDILADVAVAGHKEELQALAAELRVHLMSLGHNDRLWQLQLLEVERQAEASRSELEEATDGLEEVSQELAAAEAESAEAAQELRTITEELSKSEEATASLQAELHDILAEQTSLRKQRALLLEQQEAQRREAERLKQEELRRLEEERLAEERRQQEEEQRRQEMQRQEAERLAQEELHRLEEEQLAEERRQQEEEHRRQEMKRQEAERLKQEELRLEEARLAEQRRQQEEQALQRERRVIGQSLDETFAQLRQDCAKSCLDLSGKTCDPGPGENDLRRRIQAEVWRGQSPEKRAERMFTRPAISTAAQMAAAEAALLSAAAARKASVQQLNEAQPLQPSTRQTFPRFEGQEVARCERVAPWPGPGHPAARVAAPQRVLPVPFRGDLWQGQVAERSLGHVRTLSPERVQCWSQQAQPRLATPLQAQRTTSFAAIALPQAEEGPRQPIRTSSPLRTGSFVAVARPPELHRTASPLRTTVYPPAPPELHRAASPLRTAVYPPAELNRVSLDGSYAVLPGGLRSNGGYVEETQYVGVVRLADHVRRNQLCRGVVEVAPAPKKSSRIAL
ncbi:unnamed protein product [Effrenium voratum]|uniref:Uncharacterized protein n=1 Tax=Effrenium voratum TaxID=2562239 RepID=A0AA36N2H4_9DINO|nr:unnamed protein product [Effrenium voratum]